MHPKKAAKPSPGAARIARERRIGAPDRRGADRRETPRPEGRRRSGGRRAADPTDA